MDHLLHNVAMVMLNRNCDSRQLTTKMAIHLQSCSDSYHSYKTSQKSVDIKFDYNSVFDKYKFKSGGAVDSHIAIPHVYKAEALDACAHKPTPLHLLPPSPDVSASVAAPSPT